MAMCKVNASLHFAKRLPNPNNRATTAETYWVPNTDVYVTEGGLVIKVELAGIRREELELTAEAGQLRISGHRPDGCRGAKCNFLLMEINYGAFESVIQIPDGFDLGQARAVYQNGFLRIDVPAHSRSPKKPHSVPIASEQE
jgi:HSP20 family protein